MLNRRSFLTGLIAAPVVIRAASLMPVRPWIDFVEDPVPGSIEWIPGGPISFYRVLVWHSGAYRAGDAAYTLFDLPPGETRIPMDNIKAGDHVTVQQIVENAGGVRYVRSRPIDGMVGGRLI
jgi:hypothetical protein